MQPAILVERCLGFLGLVVVAASNDRSARDEFARSSNRQVVAGLRVNSLVLGKDATEGWVPGDPGIF